MFSDWIKDVRYAARGLARNPGFTVVTVLALALGIGSLTPTFSLINAYLLRPLPFEEPDRLVHLWETAPRQSFFQSRVSYPNFRASRESSEWKAKSGTPACSPAGERRGLRAPRRARARATRR